MTVNASDRTLGLINIWQVLRKLCWELWLIKSTPDKLNSGVKPIDVLHVQDAGLYATINAASTALALVDWLYHTIREDQILEGRLKDLVGYVDTSSDKSFLKFFRERYPFYQCMPSDLQRQQALLFESARPKIQSHSVRTSYGAVRWDDRC